MKKRSLLIAAAVVMATLFMAAGIYAASAPDVIQMQNPGFKKHSKGIVVFHHHKHVAEYGATCGNCHHDDSGQPLTDLKDGDDVNGCGECHSEFGKISKADKKLKKKEKVAKYYREALHENCIGCHKDHNKKNKLRRNDPKAAPTSCKDCHPKK